MNKLIIQIPCFNEVDTLPDVIRDLPKMIDGIDVIETLVIDDGSTDGTFELANKFGVNHVIRNGHNRGLAQSYNRGLEESLAQDADIIVNTDGDNQYSGRCIEELIRPIVQGKADMVVGCRDIKNHKEFSFFKKCLQRVGSHIVRKLSGANIQDATSGFRAISRNTAVQLSVMSSFSYTLETLIQAGRTGLKITSVPIDVNAKTRESRLFKSKIQFILKQLGTLLKIYIFYCPMRFFSWLAAASLFISIVLAARISYYMWFADPMAKVKVGSTTLLLFTSISTILFLVTGLLGSVMSGIRILISDLRIRIRRMELNRFGVR